MAQAISDKAIVVSGETACVQLLSQALSEKYNATPSPPLPQSSDACEVDIMPTCEGCRREVAVMTTHHIVSRTRRKKARKDLIPADGKSRPVYLCRPCHKRIDRLPIKDVELYF